MAARAQIEDKVDKSNYNNLFAMSGGLSVMVIYVGNRTGDQSSNPRQSCLHFISHYCSWEWHEPICFPSPPTKDK